MIRQSSRHYWRQRARIERVEVQTDAAEGVTDASSDQLDRELLVRKVLSLLTSRDRNILRLHYFDRLTAAANAE